MKIENLQELNSKKHKKQTEKDLSFFFGSAVEKELIIEKNNDEQNIVKNKINTLESAHEKKNETKQETEFEHSLQVDETKSLLEKEEIKFNELMESMDSTIHSIKSQETIVEENIEELSPSQKNSEPEPEHESKIEIQPSQENQNTLKHADTVQKESNNSKQAASNPHKPASSNEQVYVLNEQQLENIILTALNKKDIIDRQQRKEVKVSEKDTKPKNTIKKSKPKKKNNNKALTITISLIFGFLLIAATVFLFKDELMSLTNPSGSNDMIIDNEPPVFELYQNEITIDRSKLTEFECSKYVNTNSFSDNVDNFGDLAIMYNCPDVSNIDENVDQFAITYKLIDKAGNEAKKDLIVNIQN